jgi:hypothetical protein
MDDLVAWLTAQLDEDQRIAEAARGYGGGRWHHDTSYPNGYVYDGGSQPLVYDESTPSPEEAEHIAEHDPARVLREIDAKRRTLVRCQEEMLSGIPRLVHFATQTVREMAAVYEDRPGYAEALASVDRSVSRRPPAVEPRVSGTLAGFTDPDTLPKAPGCEHWRREHRDDLCPMRHCQYCRYLEKL